MRTETTDPSYGDTWRSSLIVTGGITLLMATGVAVLTQSVALLSLAVVGVILGLPVVGLLRRLPTRTRRALVFSYVAASAIATAIAWGVGGIPMSNVTATGLWLWAATTGLAALLLLLSGLAVSVRTASALGIGGRRALAAVIAVGVLLARPIITGQRCSSADVGIRCAMIPQPILENAIVAVAAGLSIWMLLSVTAGHRFADPP